jgi:hypothetical protein
VTTSSLVRVSGGCSLNLNRSNDLNDSKLADQSETKEERFE